MAKKRAVVVGGGLAGLTAAVELVQKKDFQVTVLEKQRRCGGKLASWPHPATGDFVEHGIHGWWRNYTNFFALMKRVGIPCDVLRQAKGSTIVWSNGDKQTVRPIRWPAPLFILGYLLRARVPWSDQLGPLARAAMGILAFDPTRDFRRLDCMTMRAWLKSMGIREDVERAFFEPYVRSFAFDSAENISAAAVLSAYHFYLVRHHDDIVPSWLVDDPDSLIIQRIVQYIEENGGRVVCSNRVTGLWLDATDDVKGVVAERVEGDGVVAGPRYTEGADHVVLAADVENCGKLIPVRWRSKTVFRNIELLGTTPVLVARLWFEGRDLLGDATTGIFVDYPVLDNFFVLSNLQNSFCGREVTVVEVQGYMVDRMVCWSKTRQLQAVLKDLESAFECLKATKLKHREVLMHEDSFAHQGPKSDELRPGTRTGVAGLYLAGDWVNPSPAVWHMERAVVSGKLAASAVLEATSGGKLTIWPMRRTGLLFRACVAIAKAACWVDGWRR